MCEALRHWDRDRLLEYNEGTPGSAVLGPDPTIRSAGDAEKKEPTGSEESLWVGALKEPRWVGCCWEVGSRGH